MNIFDNRNLKTCSEEAKMKIKSVVEAKAENIRLEGKYRKIRLNRFIIVFLILITQCCVHFAS